MSSMNWAWIVTLLLLLAKIWLRKEACVALKSIISMSELAARLIRELASMPSMSAAACEERFSPRPLPKLSFASPPNIPPS